MIRFSRPTWYLSVPLRRRLLLALALLASCFAATLSVWAQTENADKPLLVFAAASLKDALEPVARDYEVETGQKVLLSIAGSSGLARQIAAGAPADVFISADVDWAAWLQAQNLTIPESQRPIARNQLALVAPQASRLKDGDPIEDILRRWRYGGEERLAVADPDHVPAGRYARATLKTMDAVIGPYEQLEKRFAITGNVRLASLLVARREVPLGIVYRSEAIVDERIKLVGLFPGDAHPDIVYPAVKLLNGSAQADRFLDYLGTERAQMHFVKAGLFLPARGL